MVIFTLYKQNIIILPSIYAIIQPHYDPLARLYAWQKCLWECLMAQKNLLRYIVPERTKDILVFKNTSWDSPSLASFSCMSSTGGGEEW